MQKNFNEQVKIDYESSAASSSELCAHISCLNDAHSWHNGLCLPLLKDDHHEGHATDEEKLASSAGGKPDKDQNSE